MAGPGHVTMTRAGLECLPPWQLGIWGPERDALAETYSWYGDTYYGNKKELGPYVELPDGSVPMEMGKLRDKKNYGHAVDFWESPFHDPCEREIGHYLRRITEWLAAGDVHSAAQCAGTVSHYIADGGFPPHTPDAGDLEYIKDFFPPPDGFESFAHHSYIESIPPAPCSIVGYRPRLLGLTPEESAANFLDLMAAMVRAGRALLVPLMRAVYEGRREAIETLLGQNVGECARVFADVMYTATCLGAQRFDARDVEVLKTLRLTWRWPYRQTAWAPYPYWDPSSTAPLRQCGFNLDARQQRVRCALPILANGRVQTQEFEEALGAGAYFEFHYRVAAGIYSRFTSWVGIHAVLGARRKVDAEVKIDGQTIFKDVLTAGQPALKVDVQANGCRNIQLIASGPHYSDPDGNENHVVWAEPRLIK